MLRLVVSKGCADSLLLLVVVAAVRFKAKNESISVVNFFPVSMAIEFAGLY